MKVGDKVWFRGRWSDDFSLRGVIETIREDGEFGVRLENGNFSWAQAGQLKERG